LLDKLVTHPKYAKQTKTPTVKTARDHRANPGPAGLWDVETLVRQQFGEQKVLTTRTPSVTRPSSATAETR
jgi:hypothetical protein